MDKTSAVIMDRETERSFSRMIYGHEIWIEGVKKEGDEISVIGLYGHKLLPDKPMPTDYANPVVYDNNGPMETPDRDIINEPRGWQFTFKDNGAKVYTFYIDSCSTWVTDDEGWHRGNKRDFSKTNYSGSFRMMAKRIIPVDGCDAGEVVHAELEIMPDKGKFKVGTDGTITVLYEGKPLSNNKVLVYNRAWQNIEEYKTDSAGKLTIPIKDKGDYVFITKYTDTTKVSDDFDETVFSMTLTVEAE